MTEDERVLLQITVFTIGTAMYFIGLWKRQYMAAAGGLAALLAVHINALW